MDSTRQRLSVFLIILVLYVVAGLFQQQMVFNWDVSWLMHVTHNLLAGGSYTNDFFELNPPLIIYLYAPAVWVNTIFSLPPMVGLQIYIFMLATASLYYCYVLSPKIFQENFTEQLFLIAATFIFLILPVYDFGQREHLFIIFSLPYFLLVGARLNDVSFNVYFAAGIGLFASAGFALKPYFLIAPLLVEIYYLALRRQLFCNVRPETVMIAVFLIGYLGFIDIVHHDYLAVVLPYVIRTYYATFASSWINTIANPLAIFCVIPIIFHLLLYKKNPYKVLCSVLLLAMLGMFVSYLVQRSSWHDHILPAYSVAILLTILLFSILFSRTCINKLVYCYLLVLVFAFPLYNTVTLYYDAVMMRKLFKPLTQFLQDHASNKHVDFFCDLLTCEYPFIDYAAALPSSRTSDVNWVAGAQDHHVQDVGLHQRDKQFNMQMLMTDLLKNKPQYIFVDVSTNKRYFTNKNFSYIEFFSEDPVFRTLWKSYQYFSVIDIPGAFTLQVYKYNGT
jgi:hypothetical protein